EIIAEINEIDDFELVKRIDKGEAISQGYLEIIGEEVDQRYLEEMIKVLPARKLATEKGKELTIIYTPLHGTGNIPVKRLLEKLGFSNFYPVEEQTVADPDFSTVESPNPEDFSAYKMALELAQDYNPDLIMATDPDADRIGLVVKDTAGEYRNLTG